MHLHHITGQSYYLKGPVNIGVFVTGRGGCILVDTGLDETSGRQVMRALRDEGLVPTAIVNTHAHADHFGGNRFIVQRTGARVCAGPLHRAIIENPFLSPFYLYGAAPIREITGKFLMAEACAVDEVLAPGPVTLEGAELQIIDLDGHAPGQLGVATPDGVLYAGDAFLDAGIIDKYRLLYNADIAAAKNTLERLKETAYGYYLPGHGSLTDGPGTTLDRNIEAIRETEELILGCCVDGLTREEVMTRVVAEYGINLNPEQYVLVFSTISAYLAALHNEGRLALTFKDHRMLWTSTA